MSKERGHRFHYGWAVLIMGTLGTFGALGLARFGYAMVLPNMQAGLGMSNGQAGLLATISLTGYLTLAILGGALASRFGGRIVAAVGLVAAGIGLFMTGLSRSFMGAAFWNSLAGMGSGAANVAIMGLLPAWFAKKRRGLAAGTALMGSSSGLVFAGFLVPRIIGVYQDSGWKVSWVVFGITALFLAAGVYLIVRNNPAQVGLRPIGEDNGSAASAEPRKKVPFRAVYLSPPVWYLGLVYFAFGFSYIIFMTFFIKHLVTTGGFSEASAGNYYMAMGWVSMVSGLVWGAVSDAIGRKTTLTVLYLIQATAYTIFGMGHSTLFIVLPVLLFGITAWSIPAIMSATCGDILGPELAPATLGFITLFFGLGQVLGPSVAGFMADTTGSFGSVFLAGAIVAFLGAVSSMVFIRTPVRQPAAFVPTGGEERNSPELPARNP